MRGRTVGWLTIVVVAAAAIVGVLVTRGDGAASLPPDVGVVEWVIDGDTVDIDIGGREERVRLIGIDTPELHAETGKPECMAQEAREFSAAQLPAGTEVRLERDVVGRDDYGRLLAYVYRRDDDVMINELVVSAGYARPLTIVPNDAHRERFVAGAHAAQAGGVGLWSACR